MDFHGRRVEQGDCRAPTRILKLVKLAILMDARNDVEAGLRKSLHPLGRSRRPEQRKPRRLSNHDTAQELERMLAKLAATHPELAAYIRASAGHSEN